jgi:hypothetical protein
MKAIETYSRYLRDASKKCKLLVKLFGTMALTYLQDKPSPLEGEGWVRGA